MPNCEKHGYYEKSFRGMCPKCTMDVARGDAPPPGKTPLGQCPKHGYYYAKYKGIYDGCPVCARQKENSGGTPKENGGCGCLILIITAVGLAGSGLACLATTRLV